LIAANIVGCSVREGINIFLAGFVPTENMRFREESLTFKVRLPSETCHQVASPPCCVHDSDNKVSNSCN